MGHLEYANTRIYYVLYRTKERLRGLIHPRGLGTFATGDTSSAIKQLPRDPYLRITSKPIKAEELLTLIRALLAA